MLYKYRRHIAFVVVAVAAVAIGYNMSSGLPPEVAAVAGPTKPAKRLVCADFSCHATGAPYMPRTRQQANECQMYVSAMKFRVLFCTVTAQAGYEDPSVSYRTAIPACIGAGAGSGVSGLSFAAVWARDNGVQMPTLFDMLQDIQFAMVCPMNMIFFHRVDVAQIQTNPLFYGQLSRVLYDRTMGRRLVNFGRNRLSVGSESIGDLERLLMGMLPRPETAVEDGGDDDFGYFVPVEVVFASTMQSAWDVSAAALGLAIEERDGRDDGVAASLARIAAAHSGDATANLRGFFRVYHGETAQLRDSIENRLSVVTAAQRYLLYQAHPGFLCDIMTSLATADPLTTMVDGRAMSMTRAMHLSTLVNPWAVANWIDYMSQYEGDSSAAHRMYREFMSDPHNTAIVETILSLRLAVRGPGQPVLSDVAAVKERLLVATYGSESAPQTLPLPPGLIRGSGTSNYDCSAGVCASQIVMTTDSAQVSDFDQMLRGYASSKNPSLTMMAVGELLGAFSAVSTPMHEYVARSRLARDLTSVVRALLPRLDTAGAEYNWRAFAVETAAVAAAPAMLAGGAPAAVALATAQLVSMTVVAGAAAVVGVALASVCFLLGLDGGWRLSVEQLQAMVVHADSLLSYEGKGRDDPDALRYRSPGGRLNGVTLQDIAMDPSFYVEALNSAREAMDGLPMDTAKRSAVGILQDALYAVSGTGAAAISSVGRVGIRGISYRDTVGVLSWFRSSFVPTTLQEDFGVRTQTLSLAWVTLCPEGEAATDDIRAHSVARSAVLSNRADVKVVSVASTSQGGPTYETVADVLVFRYPYVAQEVAVEFRLRFVLRGSPRADAIAAEYDQLLDSVWPPGRNSATSEALVTEMHRAVHSCGFVQLFGSTAGDESATVAFTGFCGCKIYDLLPSLQAMRKLLEISRAQQDGCPVDIAAVLFVSTTDDRRGYMTDLANDPVWCGQDGDIHEKPMSGRSLVVALPPCFENHDSATERLYCGRSPHSINHDLLDGGVFVDVPNLVAQDEVVKRALRVSSVVRVDTEHLTEQLWMIEQAIGTTLRFPDDGLDELLLSPEGADVMQQFSDELHELMQRSGRRETGAENDWFMAQPYAQGVNEFWCYVVGDGERIRMTVQHACGMAAVFCSYNDWTRPPVSADEEPDARATVPAGRPAPSDVSIPLPRSMFGVLTPAELEQNRLLWKDTKAVPAGDRAESFGEAFAVAKIAELRQSGAGDGESHRSVLQLRDRVNSMGDAADAPERFKAELRRIGIGIALGFEQDSLSVVNYVRGSEEISVTVAVSTATSGVTTAGRSLELAADATADISLHDWVRQFVLRSKCWDACSPAPRRGLSAGHASTLPVIWLETVYADRIDIPLSGGLVPSINGPSWVVKDTPQNQRLTRFSVVYMDTSVRSETEPLSEAERQSTTRFAQSVFASHFPSVSGPLKSLSFFASASPAEIRKFGEQAPLYTLMLLSKTAPYINVGGGDSARFVTEVSGDVAAAGEYQFLTLGTPGGSENGARMAELQDIMLRAGGMERNGSALTQWCVRAGNEGFSYRVFSDITSRPIVVKTGFMSPVTFANVERAVRLMAMISASKNAGRPADILSMVPGTLLGQVRALLSGIEHALSPSAVAARQKQFVGLLRSLRKKTYGHDDAPSNSVLAFEIKIARRGLSRMMQPDATEQQTWCKQETVELTAEMSAQQIISIDESGVRLSDGTTAVFSAIRKANVYVFARCFAECFRHSARRCIRVLLAPGADGAPCDAFAFGKHRIVTEGAASLRLLGQHSADAADMPLPEMLRTGRLQSHGGDSIHTILVDNAALMDVAVSRYVAGGSGNHMRPLVMWRGVLNAGLTVCRPELAYIFAVHLAHRLPPSELVERLISSAAGQALSLIGVYGGRNIRAAEHASQHDEQMFGDTGTDPSATANREVTSRFFTEHECLAARAEPVMYMERRKLEDSPDLYMETLRQNVKYIVGFLVFCYTHKFGDTKGSVLFQQGSTQASGGRRESRLVDAMGMLVRQLCAGLVHLSGEFVNCIRGDAAPESKNKLLMSLLTQFCVLARLDGPQWPRPSLAGGTATLYEDAIDAGVVPSEFEPSVARSFMDHFEKTNPLANGFSFVPYQVRQPAGHYGSSDTQLSTEPVDADCQDKNAFGLLYTRELPPEREPIAPTYTSGGCQCVPVTIDRKSGLGSLDNAQSSVSWMGCGSEGWCDVVEGCEAAKDADSSQAYHGWDTCTPTF